VLVSIISWAFTSHLPLRKAPTPVMSFFYLFVRLAPERGTLSHAQSCPRRRRKLALFVLNGDLSNRGARGGGFATVKSVLRSVRVVMSSCYVRCVRVRGKVGVGVSWTLRARAPFDFVGGHKTFCFFLLLWHLAKSDRRYAIKWSLTRAAWSTDCRPEAHLLHNGYRVFRGVEVSQLSLRLPPFTEPKAQQTPIKGARKKRPNNIPVTRIELERSRSLRSQTRSSVGRSVGG